MRTILFTLAFSLGCHAATLMRIACASPGGTDLAGNVWQADAYYSATSARWDATSQAALAALDLPYRALRYSAPTGSAFSYAIPLPSVAADYTLTLYFQEPNKAARGLRVFDVLVNGAVVKSGLDLYAETGAALKPYALAVPLSAIAGALAVKLVPVAGMNAVLSGIQLDSVEKPPALPFAPYLTGTTLAVPQCPAIGLAFAYILDTQRLYWCFDGSNWNPVSDLVLGPSIFQVKQVDACQGGATYTTSDGQLITWDCTGLYRAILSRMDGSYISLVGEHIDLPSDAYGVAKWLPAK